MLQKNTDPVHKVTIIPRGRALGVTQQLPVEDRYTLRRDYVLERLAVIVGGRAAEKIIYNEITTGAGNDIEVATDLARRMVCEWGMSDAIGPVSFAAGHESPFPGQGGGGGGARPYSEAVAQEIDSEVRRIITEAYARAEELLSGNLEMLELMTAGLLEFEALDAADLKSLHEDGNLDWIRQKRERAFAKQEQDSAERVPKTGFTSKIKDQSGNLAPSI